MNKLLTKIAGSFLGLSMAIGVGVAAGSQGGEAKVARAATAGSNYVEDAVVSAGGSISTGSSDYYVLKTTAGLYYTGVSSGWGEVSSSLSDAVLLTLSGNASGFTIYDTAASAYLTYTAKSFTTGATGTSLIVGTGTVSGTSYPCVQNGTTGVLKSNTGSSNKLRWYSGTSYAANMLPVQLVKVRTASVAAYVDGNSSVNAGTEYTAVVKKTSDNSNVSGTITYTYTPSNGAVISSPTPNAQGVGTNTTGKFTASSAGKVTVSASLSGYTITSKEVTINSITPYINLSLSSGASAYTGQTVSISAEYGNGVAGLNWSVESGSISGNPTTSNSGYSAKISNTAGALTIRATDTGSALYSEVSVTVTKTAFTTSPAASTSVAEGKTTTLTAVLNSGGAINWTSDDTDVATVSAGVVTGVAEGTTTITAQSADDTSVTASCTVTVIQILEASHTYVSTDGLTVNIKNNSDVTVATATMAKKTGSGYSAPTFSNNQYRLYGSSTLTIVPAMNYDLLSISATFVDNKGGKNSDQLPDVTYSVDGGTTTSNFVSGTTYEVDSPEEILIETSASAGNRGFKTITVVYKPSDSQVSLTEITYSGTLLKTTQYVGQKFDSVGLSFTAHYDNDSSAPILSSDIEWDDLAIGNSVSGTYGGVSVTVTGLTIINTTDVAEIIFFNNFAADKTTYTDLESHSVLGDFDKETSYIYNGMDSSIKFSSNDNGGTFSMTSNATGKYISKIIFVAKSYTGDNTSLSVAGASTSDSFELTESWASYELDVSDDEGNTATFSSAKSKRCYVHSITLILAAEDKTALQFANKILDELTCTASGNTAPSTSQWNALKAFYNGSGNVSAEAKQLLQETSAPYATWKDFEVTSSSTESEIICAALVKYDYVVAKYGALEDGNGNKLYEDFIERDPAPLSGSNNSMLNIGSDNAVIIITIVSLISISAFGAFLFLRKRKEQ